MSFPFPFCTSIGHFFVFPRHYNTYSGKLAGIVESYIDIDIVLHYALSSVIGRSATLLQGAYNVMYFGEYQNCYEMLQSGLASIFAGENRGVVAQAFWLPQARVYRVVIFHLCFSCVFRMIVLILQLQILILGVGFQ